MKGNISDVSDNINDEKNEQGENEVKERTNADNKIKSESHLKCYTVYYIN